MNRTAHPALALAAVALALVRVPPAMAVDTTVESVRVPGGSFIMGTREDDVPELKEKYGISFPGVFEEEVPAHRVTLSDFRMDRHEVTQARFAAFLEQSPEWERDRVADELHNGLYLEGWEGARPQEGMEQHPVVFITWHAAQAFCRWAGGRLPTEAEWEWAARAGDEREFPWGGELPDVERANYHANDIDRTTPVGSYPPNELGLHDMAGNVWEFLLDEWLPYGEDDAIDPIAGGPVDDEELLGVRGRRAVRGASYGGAVVNLRTRWRDSHVVTNAIEFVGFRCAYPVDDG
jgi:formylglycine-generating enzyme required for sulfatase activity